jgi:YHS domain-containing protein
MKRINSVCKWRLGAALSVPMLAFAAGVDVNVDGDGIAIHGYDPVAYFTRDEAVKGSPEYTHEVDGAVYQFANNGSRDAFATDPERYMPQFGGFCAMGTVMGRKLDTDPQAWRIVDGKLYLNLNKDVQTRWLSDILTHIAQAEANWPQLRDVPADQLG